MEGNFKKWINRFNSKQDTLTEDNVGQFMDSELATKSTPTSGDTVLGRDSVSGKAVEIPTSSLGGSGSVDTSNLVPYTGANKDVNIGAFYFEAAGYKVPTGTATQYLMADGSTSTLPINLIKGTGTVNYLTKFTASGTIGNSIVYENNNSVSIGDNVSDATLRVKAQGALSTDIAFRVRNSTNTQDFLVVTGVGDVYNRGAQGSRYSTFFGENVGRNSTEDENSAFGYEALQSNTTGYSNSAFGSSALYANIAGVQNSAFGSNALVSNISGNLNSAFGLATLFSNTTGYSNSAFGSSALSSNTTGARNIAIGNNAGGSIIGGSPNSKPNNSIFIGVDTKANANNETNQIVIGHSAIGNGSNTATIGNDSTTNVYLKGITNSNGFKTPTGTATQALTADGGVFDLNTKADLVGGKIPASQLPAYVDDVLEFANLASFPATGESGKIYIAIDTNLTYRWGGSSYVVMSSSLALGETSSTAYRGDRGKTAYDHSQTTGNPHGTTKNDIGLGNVDNTSDLNKPISTATQTALNTKANIDDIPSKTSFTYDILVSNWTLVSGKYEAVISNAGILSNSFVDVIPSNDHVDIVRNAQIYPSVLISAGSVKVYSKFLPSGTISVTVNIN